ncbi:MAG: hypothetical protein WD824_06005 [Cyclobacteriaceae bacterium]
MKTGFLIILTIVLFSCSNDDLNTVTALEGKWVEVNTKTDTLTFGKIGEQDAMILGRGREMRNGVSSPKYGSGPYEYEILTKKISLRWYLSSNSAFNEFFFNQTGGMLIVEKFYDTNIQGTLLIFEKL